MVSTEKSSLATTPIKRAAPTTTKPAAQAGAKVVAPATPATPVAKPATRPGAKKAPAKASLKKSAPVATAGVKKTAKTAAQVSATKALAASVKPVPTAVLGGSAKAPAPAAVKPKTVKPVKAKKPKLVRDSFTIPKAEYAVLDELKQRAGKLASPAKKSELLRAGIKALAAMPDAAFLAALKAVPAIKTGRPAKD